MKIIKTFESFQSDRILDKISRNGMNSLTELEKEYLDAYSLNKPNVKSLEKDLDDRDDKISGTLNYDPREDNEFFKDQGMDFSDWSDEDIEDGRFNIIWDDISNDDIEKFIIIYKIDRSILTDNDKDFLTWDKLPYDVKENFIDYIQSQH